jgi:hypothetical protein
MARMTSTRTRLIGISPQHHSHNSPYSLSLVLVVTSPLTVMCRWEQSIGSLLHHSRRLVNRGVATIGALSPPS